MKIGQINSYNGNAAKVKGCQIGRLWRPVVIEMIDSKRMLEVPAGDLFPKKSEASRVIID